MEINDYPPANAIKSNESRDYPIIRCEDCHEIPAIDLKMDKGEIQIKCEKEGKTKNIPFESFFETIKRYEDINCCQFCKNKNPSQKYYLCKTCSNKILCQKCFDEHNKNDDVIKFNIDSTCKKHYNPFESYCPICKENKCSYCSIDHDESHEKNEILLKKKLFKKNKIEGFQNTLKKVNNDKEKIEQKINAVMKELEDKIEFINNLKKKFFECLNMKLQFIELIMNNYEKKLKNFDVNFYIINNLEKQIHFNLLELNLNKNDSLDKKIENITGYLKENLNSQFNLDNEEGNDEIPKPENILDNDATNVEYKILKNFDFNVDGFLDFNENLFCFYSSDIIYFISKNDYKTKFKVEEYGLNEIKICKKINDSKLLIYTGKNIIFLNIIDNNDYQIDKRINFSCDIYDFNSHLDLLYLNYKKQKNNKFIKFNINLILFPDFNNTKNSFSLEIGKYYNKDRLQFLNNNIFFHFSTENLELYEIKNNKCSLEMSLEIYINSENASIIELNNEFYCLNDKYKILLLNKKDLSIAKTINSNSEHLGILKISSTIVTKFISTYSHLIFENYTILSNGIKWDPSKKKYLLDENAYNFCCDKNYILFMKGTYYGQKGCCLFEIKATK